MGVANYVGMGLNAAAILIVANVLYARIARAPRLLDRRVQDAGRRLASDFDPEEEDTPDPTYCLERDVLKVEGVDDEECGEVFLDTFSVQPGCRHKFARKMARMAQAEFGLPKRTEANRLVVQRFIRDLMRKLSVRETHIATLLPIAVGLTFIPNEGHVADREYTEGVGYRDKVALVEGPIDGRTPSERSWWRFWDRPSPRITFSK
jgi:hypothetical protein